MSWVNKVKRYFEECFLLLGQMQLGGEFCFMVVQVGDIYQCDVGQGQCGWFG